MMSAQSRNCGTMLYLEQQTQNNPNLKQAHIYEIKIQNWILSKETILLTVSLQFQQLFISFIIITMRILLICKYNLKSIF